MTVWRSSSFGFNKRLFILLVMLLVVTFGSPQVISGDFLINAFLIDIPIASV